MIRFLDMLALLFQYAYVSVFFVILLTFLPLRKNRILRVLAYAAAYLFSVTTIYSNDLANLLGMLLGFCAYVIVFHRGRWVEKLTTVLIFYPTVIAKNYLMENTGRRCFFAITNALPEQGLGWTPQQYFLSSAINTLLRLFIRFAARRFFRASAVFILRPISAIPCRRHTAYRSWNCGRHTTPTGCATKSGCAVFIMI